jgi:carbamoyl-phosphate synthase small subunit
MFNGHRGINHPAKNLYFWQGEITSQNHGFAVNKEELEANESMEITHLHLNDSTVAGGVKDKIVSLSNIIRRLVPVLIDSSYLFDQFVKI